MDMGLKTLGDRLKYTFAIVSFRRIRTAARLDLHPFQRPNNMESVHEVT